MTTIRTQKLTQDLQHIAISV